ncbi:MAG: hypothetical protein GY791_05140 [Alphaproteobacteria bacterium]|nr:hypothetical protein [Alphaproteobacteria bacterium]
MAPNPDFGTVGVNFSNSFQSTPIDPVRAAKQIASVGVKTVKMFNYTQTEFLDAARASGLRVLTAVPNDGLAALAKGDTAPVIKATQPYADIVAAICVGNEPLGAWHKGKYTQALVPAVTNLAKALEAARLDVKVTVPFNYAIMGQSYPPSQGVLKGDLTAIITQVCTVLRSTGSAFLINIYPYLDWLNNRDQIPLDYCLFTAGPDHWVHDGDLVYKNIFAASYDALTIALGRIGFDDLEVVVGECGWPTAGDVNATAANAGTFNQNLINHCGDPQPTPRHFGPISCFVFEMYDEDRKPTGPGAFEHYWGVYTAAGGAKYPITW